MSPLLPLNGSCAFFQKACLRRFDQICLSLSVFQSIKLAPILIIATFLEFIPQTTMRVWDVLFYEGAQVLFLVALAIFKVTIFPFVLWVSVFHTSVLKNESQFLMKLINSYLQMKEDELLLTHHVGDVIHILHKTTHHMFDPDDLLTVS